MGSVAARAGVAGRRRRGAATRAAPRGTPHGSLVHVGDDNKAHNPQPSPTVPIACPTPAPRHRRWWETNRSASTATTAMTAAATATHPTCPHRWP